MTMVSLGLPGTCSKVARARPWTVAASPRVRTSRSKMTSPESAQEGGPPFHRVAGLEETDTGVLAVGIGFEDPDAVALLFADDDDDHEAGQRLVRESAPGRHA